MSQSPLILTVDDDPHLTELIDFRVRQWGLEAHSVHSAEALWRFLDSSLPPVILMDVQLGDADGAELVAQVKSRWPTTQVITITRSQTVEAAVRCMKNGASDFITKPIDFERLRTAIDEALQVKALSRVDSVLDNARPPSSASRPPGFLGQSEAVQTLFERLENIAPTDVSVLILGETGTGKELTARAIHEASARRHGPFVAVNAAAIPHELIESMLFGHVKGAFTGAHQDHVGYCEQADGGTLFLDEISEMSFEVQAKLLRFLQDHVVQAVGSRHPRKVDVRVLAATNTRPQEMIEQRTLREDLYYRLRVVSLTLPPLRRRHGDIPLLAEHFLHAAAAAHERDFQRFSPQALIALETYPWPGNVRQLQHFIEEAVVLHRGDVLEASMLPEEIFVSDAANSGTAGRPPLDGSHLFSQGRQRSREMRDKRALVQALEAVNGKPEAAAERLGISRATVYRRMKKFGLL